MKINPAAELRGVKGEEIFQDWLSHQKKNVSLGKLETNLFFVFVTTAAAATSLSLLCLSCLLQRPSSLKSSLQVTFLMTSPFSGYLATGSIVLTLNNKTLQSLRGESVLRAKKNLFHMLFNRNNTEKEADPLLSLKNRGFFQKKTVWIFKNDTVPVFPLPH